MADAAFKASTAKARSGQRGFVPVILRGRADSRLPPNVIHKRISQKSYPTRDEAVTAGRDYMARKNLPAWVRS